MAFFGVVSIRGEFVGRVFWVPGVVDQKPGTLPNLHGTRVGEVEKVLDGIESWRIKIVVFIQSSYTEVIE